MPGLYGGTRRQPGSLPLGANVPQAWAAGSEFHLIRAILGLEANAHTHSLDPVLPRWLPEVTMHHLRVENSTATIQFWSEDNHGRFEVLWGVEMLSCDGELQVQHLPPPNDSTPLSLGFTQHRV